MKITAKPRAILHIHVVFVIRRKLCFHTFFAEVCYSKLDGVGPIFNRSSTDKLHHFVRKKEEERKTRPGDLVMPDPFG